MAIVSTMNIRLILLFTVCLLAISVAAQKPPTDAYDPSSWSKYTVPGEEFSVALPTRPAMSTNKEFRPRIQRERKERNLRITFAGVDYGIDVFENPTRLSLEYFVAEYKGDADFIGSAESAVTVDGIAGKEYSTKSSSQARVQLFATKRRLYRFVAVGGNADNAAVKRFFSSISFGKDADAVRVSDGPGMPLELSGERIYKGSEVDKKLRLITKPEPKIPERERGLVVLQAVFSWDGRVVNLQVVSTFGEELTKAAIDAAQKIKFEPAMKNGKPVSMYMTLEYYFN